MAIQGISHGYESHRYLSLKSFKAKREPSLLIKKKGQSLQDYNKAFQAHLDVFRMRKFDVKGLVNSFGDYNFSSKGLIERSGKER